MRTVLVHGLGGSSRWWRELERRLDGLALEPVDLPRGRDLEAQERWLEERLEPRANVVAHSLGGLLAARVAARRPELVERLALIAPAGLPGPSLLRHAWPLGHALARLRPSLAPMLLRDAVRAGPLGLLGAGKAVLAADVRPELGAIAAPTLLVWGAEDRLVPAANAEAWASALGDVRVEILPRTAHAPMLERPDEVSRLLREFLA